MFGIVGTGIILLAFLLNQFGRWSSESLSYDVANAIGSGILLYYAYSIQSWPFMVLNGVWFLVSARDIYKDVKKR